MFLRGKIIKIGKHRFPLLLLYSFLSLSCARSTSLVRGDEAEALIKNQGPVAAPEKFTYAEIRDRREGKLVLALFNRDEGGEAGGNFRWIKKERNVTGKPLTETYNIVLLDSPGGERGDHPPEEKIKEVMESKLLPVVILDGRGDFRAIVYKWGSVNLKAFLRPEGTIRLEVGRRTRDRGNIDYSFQIH
jgi:hypothetical protein